MGVGSGQAPTQAPAPAAKPAVPDNSPVLPATGTRIPASPSAKASVLGGPTLASVGMAREAVGGVAANVQVAETPMTTSNPETDQMVSLGKAVVVAAAGAMGGAAAGISGTIATAHVANHLVDKAIAAALAQPMTQTVLGSTARASAG